MSNGESLEELRERGVDFPAKDKWVQTNAKISLEWLMRDAGLSEKQRNAIESHLRGEKVDYNYYNAIRKIKRFTKKVCNM